MRFLALFLVAWIAWWAVTPLPSFIDTRINLDTALAAAVGALIFASLAWALVRRKDGQAAIVAAGRMLVVIGFLGFGGAYGAAKDAGLEFGEASLTAWAGMPAVILLTGIAITLYAKRLKGAA